MELIDKPSMNKIMGATTINQYHNWPMFDVALDLECMQSWDTWKLMKWNDHFQSCRRIDSWIFKLIIGLSLLWFQSFIWWDVFIGGGRWCIKLEEFFFSTFMPWCIIFITIVAKSLLVPFHHCGWRYLLDLQGFYLSRGGPWARTIEKWSFQGWCLKDGICFPV